MNWQQDEKVQPIPLKRQNSFLVSAFCATLFMASAWTAGNLEAGSLVDAAQRAETLDAAGKKAEAYEIMRAAAADYAANMPLTIRRAAFVTEKPVAYGSFRGAPSNTFAKGSTLITYTEPVGLAWEADKNGHFTTRFTVGFQLRKPDGEVLAEQDAFGNFSLTSREKLQEVFTPLTLDVSSVPAGDYVIRYKFTDLVSKAVATVDQPFAIK